MVDIQISKACTLQGIPMYALAHNEGYIAYIQPPRGTTIWENIRNDEERTKILRSFLK
jgi:hypothetical protein